ncbi:MAG: ABC transporter permease [Deltaproteobacteria bacterium]|nr:ABC transporter permease [Deltaproteobacteria bacterium]
MNSVLAIARRELKSYFDSPIAYIVVAVYLLVSGGLFFSTLFLFGRADLRGFFQPSAFTLSPPMLLAILTPAVTMRLVAEERKSGTFELLTTLPVSDTQVILGKFLGAMGLMLTAVGLTVVYAITVSFLGDLDWGPVVAGYVGLVLFVGALVAIGIYCSTLTDNQIVAFILAFIIGSVLFVISWLAGLFPSLAPVLDAISLGAHLESISRGVLDSRDVLYYLSLCGGALYLSVLSLGRRHA